MKLQEALALLVRGLFLESILDSQRGSVCFGLADHHIVEGNFKAGVPNPWAVEQY